MAFMIKKIKTKKPEKKKMGEKFEKDKKSKKGIAKEKKGTKKEVKKKNIKKERKKSLGNFIKRGSRIFSKKKLKRTKKAKKALVLFSGGLDSMLVIKLLRGLGFEVEAVLFNSHFYPLKKTNFAETFCNKEGIKLHKIDLGEDYFNMLQNPKYGYGKGLNPCIDCHAFMLKKAKELAKKIKADVIATGEVLGERPFSQHLKGLKKVEEVAGLKEKVLRPLSAKILPETYYEKKGIIDRNKLLGIKGRRRDVQLKLVKKYKIERFESPGGGCLLTDKTFARKVKDLIDNKELNKENVELLKIGRHFRDKDCKYIVGRNENENEKLIGLADKKDVLFEVINIPSPITLLKRKGKNSNLYMTAALTAYYSDARQQNLPAVQVEYKTSRKVSTIVVDLKKDLKKIEEFIKSKRIL